IRCRTRKIRVRCGRPAGSTMWRKHLTARPARTARMAARPDPLLKYIRRLVSRPAPAPNPDADAVLLDRFVRKRDETAFAALVRRHAPMVLGVCRRVLRDAHEAEDAAQAVWLVLARKAATIRRRETLAAW